MNQNIGTLFNDANNTLVFRILAVIGPLLGAAIGFRHYRSRGRALGGSLSGALWGSCTTILLGMWHLLAKISERFGPGNVKGLLLFSLLFLVAVFVWTVVSTLIQQVATRPQGSAGKRPVSPHE